jgi:acyl-CoA thioester hydrolase
MPFPTNDLVMARPVVPFRSPIGPGRRVCYHGLWVVITSDGQSGAVRLDLRVRWAECDAAGIIYHAHAFDWFSEGRLAWLEAHGLSYYDVLRARGVDLLVLECEARFGRMLRPGEAVTVTTRAGGLTPTRVAFHYQVEAGGRTAATGVTRHVFVAAGHAISLSKRCPDIFAALRGQVAAGTADGKEPSAW